jgi:NAD-dependent deacetylase
MTTKQSKVRSEIKAAAEIIHDSEKTIVLTGAGISTPSGIPDFRSKESGLWTEYDPFEVASLISFRQNPEKFYDWIRPLTYKISLAQPNPAHRSLADFERSGIVQVIITQNIDGLHQRAGSKNVLEVHGSWRSLTCTACFQCFEAKYFIQPFLKEGSIPYCQNCGSVLKPDLILVGEQLPTKIWMEATHASKSCDVFIIAGSSLEVNPVAGLPLQALQNDSKIIIINRSGTYLDNHADVVINEDVALVIPQILEQIRTK